MSNNGNFKIQIGISSSGLCVIGSKAVNSLASDNNLADSKRVYGIQIGHRVAAKTDKGWSILTPTEAKNQGYNEVRRFPKNK